MGVAVSIGVILRTSTLTSRSIVARTLAAAFVSWHNGNLNTRASVEAWSSGANITRPTLIGSTTERKSTREKENLKFKKHFFFLLEPSTSHAHNSQLFPIEHACRIEESHWKGGNKTRMSSPSKRRCILFWSCTGIRSCNRSYKCTESSRSCIRCELR